MAQAECTIFRTPRRNRRLTQREGNVGRRRSLFSESRESDDDIATLSPTSSEVGTPVASPVVAVKNLESNFNQLLLNKTPLKSPAHCSPSARISPRIKGVRCLSEDTDVIKRNTFYGGRGPSIATGSVDGKSLLAYVRSAVPLKARTRLFPEDAPRERKKRARTASFLDSAKRAKKRPRLQESLPCMTKSMVMQKLNKLKAKIARERAYTKKREKLAAKENLKDITVFAEKKTSKKKESQPPLKRKYNWEIFSSGSERQFFRSMNSSVTMTPPTTSKKKKLMSSNTDFLATPQKPLLFDSDSEDDVDAEGLIDEIKKDVLAIIEDDNDKEMQAEVDNLLLQLDPPADNELTSDHDDHDENRNPNVVPSTPVQHPLSSPIVTPSTQTKLFPVFEKTPGSGSSSSSSIFQNKRNTPSIKGFGINQMLLDCGQSRLREIECPVCELVYVQGVPEDEAHHMKYHSTVSQMKYTGFKNECIAGLDGPNKVIMVKQRGADARVWKKALDFKRVVDAELGAPTGEAPPDQVFLYIKNKHVVGLLCAVMINQAHRLLQLSSDVNEDPNLPSVCSQESFPVKCGITRLWVSPTARKMGVATSMMDALRRNFMFGTILELDDIAMSSPTGDGRMFAFKYFKRNDFLVY